MDPEGLQVSVDHLAAVEADRVAEVALVVVVVVEFVEADQQLQLVWVYHFDLEVPADLAM